VTPLFVFVEREKTGEIWPRTSWYNQSEITVPFVIWNMQNFKPEYLLEWKANIIRV